ncbi:uncharacterized protein si:dkey-15h8.17 isoform X2 [Engraulis encrasicolus]|uniref:uncharacterized protein si:dkey-15h8.17 isoform X2 n=1 Tax=Engraulis encrasicolus TaxID=184585 RepID=UPI002FD16FED
MACDIIEISQHINANHQQACSDLEKASRFITEALQSEIQRNTTLRMLIHRLEEKAAENGRSLSAQTESNRQLKVQVDKLQKRLKDKDNSLVQAKQTIGVLKNELGDLKQQLHSHQNSQRTIQEVTEWLQQDGQSQESQSNDAEESVLQNPDDGNDIKQEEADEEYPSSNQSDDLVDETDSPTEQNTTIKAELVKLLNHEDIEKAISTHLPELPDQTLASLMELLEELGVETRADLVYLRESDMSKCLQPIQFRRLLSGLKNEALPVLQIDYATVTSQRPIATTTTHPPSWTSPATSSPSVSSSSRAGRPWYVDFQVKWDRMPLPIRRALESQTRPSPVDRRSMVRVVVDQMQEYELNPTRSMCHSVARNIVQEHPKCFADVGKGGDIVGDGSHSLLQQIKTRVEHKNRNSMLARHRREKRTRDTTAEAMEETSRLALRGPVDQYGCVRWSPTELPFGETPEGLNEVKNQLYRLYLEKGIGGTAEEEAEALMVRTYVIQREFLNRVPAPTVAEIQKEWPFLFSQRGFFTHFGLLTDVPILIKLQEAMGNKGDMIIRYFRKHTRDVHSRFDEVLDNYERGTSDKTMGVLLLLMAYFNEPKTSILLEADPCATAMDVQRTQKLPTTPCLIVQGELLKPRGWMLSVEERVVMGPHCDVLNGLAALFASFYNLNLPYPEESYIILEFIQRCFLGINPETGSKTKKKRGGLNQQVCTLMRKLLDFEWQAG